MKTTMTPEQLKQLNETLTKAVADGTKDANEAIVELNAAMDVLRKEFDTLKDAGGVHLPGVDVEKFSFGNVMKAMFQKQDLNTMESYEGEVFRETQKAQTVSPASAGGPRRCAEGIRLRCRCGEGLTSCASEKLDIHQHQKRLAQSLPRLSSLIRKLRN